MDRKTQLILVNLPNQSYNNPNHQYHHPTTIEDVDENHLPLIVAILVLAMHINHKGEFIVAKQVMITASEHAQWNKIIVSLLYK